MGRSYGRQRNPTFCAFALSYCAACNLWDNNIMTINVERQKKKKDRRRHATNHEQGILILGGMSNCKITGKFEKHFITLQVHMYTQTRIGRTLVRTTLTASLYVLLFLLSQIPTHVFLVARSIRQKKERANRTNRKLSYSLFLRPVLRS